MVERFVRWLLKKAGILCKIETTALMLEGVTEHDLVEIKERLERLEEKQTVFEKAQSQAEVLDEWLNGRSK